MKQKANKRNLQDIKLADKESELYIILVLITFIIGYKKKGRKSKNLLGSDITKRDRMPLLALMPTGWDIHKTYAFIFHLFKEMGIIPEVIFDKDLHRLSPSFLVYPAITPTTEKTLIERLLKDNANKIFEDPVYLDLEDDILEYVEIRNNFDTSKNKKQLLKYLDAYIDEFTTDELSNEYKLLPHESQRDFTLSKLSDFYSLLGDEFIVKESHFKHSPKLSLTYSLALLWKLDYIRLGYLDSFEWRPDADGAREFMRHNKDLSFQVIITDNAEEFLGGLSNLKNLVIENTFNDECKQLDIIKKGGKLYMLESHKEVFGDNAKYVEILKKYPYAEILTKSHGGRIDMYKIKEKIKL